ncbi:MAG: ATP-binding response regulator, partial [Polyangiaceae bacterium]
LRTPLNAILGWPTLLLKEEVTTDRERKGLDVIHRNAQAQARLISDILDVSRIIMGKLRIEPRPVDLIVIAEQAIDVVAASAAAKRVELSFAPTGPFPVTADPSRVQQVLWNLLSNAIKFTPTGGRVTLSMRPEGSSVAIEVADTGRGIDRAFLPSVFDRFRQADSSTTREMGGVGLGLAIVRHIVELHGGSVEAESAGPGRGATFRVLLPAVASYGKAERVTSHVAAPKSDSCARGLPGVRVLVVDDEPDARHLMEEILTSAGASVRAEDSATSALDSLDAFRPDVLVSDIGMPGRDGYSLMRQIRSLGIEQRGDLPSLALSAYTRAEDRAAAYAAGFMEHLGKPVSPPELIAAVAKLAGRAG